MLRPIHMVQDVIPDPEMALHPFFVVNNMFGLVLLLARFLFSKMTGVWSHGDTDI